MIKIEFEFNHDVGTFRDAIVLPVDHGMTDQEIEDLKQKRFQDWLQIVQAQES